MGNMSYVRFENTLEDLRDCYEHIDDANSESEVAARHKLIQAEDYKGTAQYITNQIKSAGQEMK
jgi:hypothetical protein